MRTQAQLSRTIESPLFAPVSINGLSLSNRIAVAPMTRISASPTGLVSEAMVRYYERFAKGGFALLITEGIYTDQAFSQGYSNQPGFSDIEQAKAWQRVTNKIHQAGGKIFAQLMHAGALSQSNRFRDYTVGPSAVRPKGKQMTLYRGTGEYPLPREMSSAEIAEAIAGFTRAAVLAIEVAGFDGVEIHGANGYLLDQFLTEYTNRREDEWGGPVANRVRLTLEVARAIRQTLGTAIPLGVRISQGKVNDFTHKWSGAKEDAATIFSSIASAGVDYIHVTEFEARRPAFGDSGPSLVNLARLSAPSTTIIANGGLHHPEHAGAILDDGADLIALGKGALANPNWPQRVLERRDLASFDPRLLTPLGDIKLCEQNDITRDTLG
jgi:2,4-dienoyl-CoA reductase-like NADH-dependent reductase (Old Yellow Enzyme family)